MNDVVAEFVGHGRDKGLRIPQPRWCIADQAFGGCRTVKCTSGSLIAALAVRNIAEKVACRRAFLVRYQLAGSTSQPSVLTRGGEQRECEVMAFQICRNGKELVRREHQLGPCAKGVVPT